MKQIKIKVKGSADQIMDRLADLEVKAKKAKYTQNGVEFVADVTDEDADNECVVTLNVAKHDAKLQSLLKETLDVTKFFDALDPVTEEEKVDEQPEMHSEEAEKDPAENVETFDKVTVDPVKIKAAFKAANELVKAGKKFKSEEEVVDSIAAKAKISKDEAKSALLFFGDECKLCSEDADEAKTPEQPSEQNNEENKENMNFSELPLDEGIEKECPVAEAESKEIDFSTLLFDDVETEEVEEQESEEVNFSALLFDDLEEDETPEMHSDEAEMHDDAEETKSEEPEMHSEEAEETKSEEPELHSEEVKTFDMVTVDPVKIKAAFKAANKLVKAGKKFKSNDEVIEAIASEAKISKEDAGKAILFFEDDANLHSEEPIAPELPVGVQVEETKLETPTEQPEMHSDDAELHSEEVDETKAEEATPEMHSEDPELHSDEEKQEPEMHSEEVENEKEETPELHSEEQFSDDEDLDEVAAEVETFSDPDNELAEQPEDGEEMPTGANAVKQLNERGK
jgi:NifU-like protein involved in Fe-S cluster formation